MPLLCSRDVNQKYCKMFYWFPNHFLYIDHGNTKSSCIYTIEMQESSFLITAKWNARLIYTFNKNNIKNNNNKNKDRITKAFKEFLLSETLLSITKIFLFHALTILLPLTLSIFLDWNNPPML